MTTYVLLIFLGLLILMRLWSRPLAWFKQQQLPNLVVESEQLLLWGGLLLSALSLGLLVLYLLMQP